MALIEWDNSFSVGVSCFDEDHKRLINMLNSLHDAMKIGKGKETLTTILEGLVEYAKQHLAAEEKLMVQYSYPEYAVHKELHDEFMSKINNYKRDLASGGTIISSKIVTLLKDWLSDHILLADKRYETFFANKLMK